MSRDEHPLHVRVAAAVGNWNDKRCHPDSYVDASRTYRAIDRFVGWLYCLGEEREVSE